MSTGRLFYDSEHDARAALVAASGREWKEIAMHIWPGMKADSAYARFRACMNPEGDQHFKWHEDVAMMRFCGQYDLLYHMCDELLHARPPRIAPEDEEVKLLDVLTASAETMNKAMAHIERLRKSAKR